jgi:hypothetical protein
MLILGSVLTVAALLLVPAAEASQLPAYHVLGDALFNLSPPDRLFLNDFGTVSLADARFGSVSATALGTPSPSIVASADLGPSSIGNIFGRADGVLTYFLEIIGPSGLVPVLIDVAGGVSASSTPGATFVVESRWDLLDPASVSVAGDDIRSGQLSGSFSQNFSRTVSLTLSANQVYSVFMLADAEAAPTLVGSRATADAFIDPIFSFGPEVDPLSYSFQFSDGIGNAIATVPEPRTLALVSAGLFLLGLLRPRRDRVDQQFGGREADSR